MKKKHIQTGIFALVRVTQMSPKGWGCQIYCNIHIGGGGFQEGALQKALLDCKKCRGLVTNFT